MNMEQALRRKTASAFGLLLFTKRKQDNSQCTYKVTLRGVRVIIVAVQKQEELHSLRVCL